jgi:hypothetical protein
MLTGDTDLTHLSGDQRQQLAAWLAEFERTWDEGRLAASVRQLPADGPLRRLALVGMVKIDLEQQWRRGRRPVIEAYLHFYPELGPRDTVPPDLIHAEYDARRRAGAPAELSSFARRFPRQAEQLRALAEGVSDQPPTVATGQHQHPLTPTTATLSGPAPEAGQTLSGQFGRYLILQKLGQGGMGAVYLAQDTQLGRRVALKVPRFSPEDGSQALERFYREARAAATVEHAGICAVYDVGAVNGVHYLTMAYVEGEQLSHVVGPDRPLPQPRAAALVRDLARALQAAHQRGVIHRDLKPANVILKPSGVPVIMDFGLARRVNSQEARLTLSGCILGTPAYMSPEQVSGDLEATGPSCDIYSLGVILYELLTGRVPFAGSMGVILSQILTQPPPAPSTRRPDLDPRLEAICLKALAKRAADRYRTAGELAQALDGYLQGARQGAAVRTAAQGAPRRAPLPGPAAPPTPTPALSWRQPPPASPRGGRIWWLVGAAVAGVVILAACLLLALKGGG